MSRRIEAFLAALRLRLRAKLNSEAVEALVADVRDRRVIQDGYGNVRVLSVSSGEMISSDETSLVDVLAGELISGAPETARRGRRRPTADEIAHKAASGDYLA